MVFPRFPDEPASGSCFQVTHRLDFPVNLFFPMDWDGFGSYTASYMVFA